MTPVSIAANTALKAIKVGSAPSRIAITPDGKTACVSNTVSGTVTPIRAATNTALTAIRAERGPLAIAINAVTTAARMRHALPATYQPRAGKLGSPYSPTIRRSRQAALQRSRATIDR